MRDTVEPEEDERLARFIVSSHSRSHPLASTQASGDDSMDAEADPERAETQATEASTSSAGRVREGEIPQELLRKYILYARERCVPKLFRAGRG